MYSYIEAAEAENSVAFASESNETARLCHSFTQNMKDSYLNAILAT